VSAKDTGVCDWSDIAPKRELGWVIVDPDGKVEGFIGWRKGRRETVEAAHKAFTPHVRDREAELRAGWVVRREQPGDRDSIRTED
jgi:hypothetical protein